MSAYLILLCLFAAAWTVAGFCAAMLLLKLRWNLVGGILILAVGLGLPLVVVNYALIESGSSWARELWYVDTIFGMLQLTYEVAVMVSCGGYLLGILAGTIVGVWPKRDDEGNRQRSARRWSTWKLTAAGPLALGVALTIFCFADIRAQQRLTELRAKHRAILEVQEDIAPRLQNDAAMLHDALILSLLEDESPDWILAGVRQVENRTQPVPTKIRRNDYDLLKIFLPGFAQTTQVREYAQRHEDAFLRLRYRVLNDGLEYRHWDEQVARFAMVHALVAIHEKDDASALQDLRLLRMMATQSLDNRIEESFSFVQIEEFRYLVFQAFLGNVSSVPDDVYQEMLTSAGNPSQNLRRGLKRQMSQHVVSSVDELLQKQPGQRFRIRDTFEQMAERIIYQEHTPNCVARLENEINQAFDGSSDPLVNTPRTMLPSIWTRNEAWLMRSGYAAHLYRAVQVRYQQSVRRELVQAIRMLESNRAEKGRFLTQREFFDGITSTQFTSAISISYLTLHDPTTGKAEGAVVATSEHTRLDDYFGLYLGPAIFPIVDETSPTLIIRANRMSGTWELAQVNNDPVRLVIPTPKASTLNLSSPMR